MRKLFKTKKGMIIALITMILITALTGCPDESAGRDTGGVDFTNYSTNAAIRVRNLTNQDLVLFKTTDGTMTRDNIIGGVDGNANDWGIKKDERFFNTATNEFGVSVLTLETYKEYKNKLGELTQTPFTRFYVFYNAAGDNSVLYELSDKIGGAWKLNIENPTNLNIELRVGGVQGPTLGYAATGMVSTTLYMQQGEYDIFPVFKKYNAQRNVVDTIYPKNDAGGPFRRGYVFDGEPDTQVFDVRQLLGGISLRSSGVAYLAFVNSSADSVRLYKGTTMVYNSTGTSYMRNGSSSVTMEIEMPEVGGNFASKMTLGGYKIGPTAASVPIVVVNEDGSTDETFEVEVDKMYQVSITGDSQTSAGLKAVIDLENPVDLGFDDIYKMN